MPTMGLPNIAGGALHSPASSALSVPLASPDDLDGCSLWLVQILCINNCSLKERWRGRIVSSVACDGSCGAKT